MMVIAYKLPVSSCWTTLHEAVCLYTCMYIVYVHIRAYTYYMNMYILIHVSLLMQSAKHIVGNQQVNPSIYFVLRFTE